MSGTQLIDRDVLLNITGPQLGVARLYLTVLARVT